MIFEHACDIVLDDVFLRLGDLGTDAEVYLKIEGLNPAGSIKLKTALSMVRDAEERGVLHPGDTIIESSSGSLGIALATVCANRGYHFVCVTDPNTLPRCVEIMTALGAKVVTVDRRDPSGGYLGSRIAYIQQRITTVPRLVWLNQYANPANRRAHELRTARAITEALPRVDHLFVGVGTSGTLMGCIRHFRAESPHTRIIAVDTVGSVSFGTPAGPRFLPGIGTSRRPELLHPELVDDLVLVPEADAVRTCRWLAGTRGLLVGGSTGSVVAAVRRLGPELPSGSCVVAISPDLGDRYTRTIYDDSWVNDVFGPECLADADDPAPALASVTS